MSIEKCLTPLLPLLLGACLAPAQTLRIESLNATNGWLTFVEPTNAAAYRVDWRTNLADEAWSTNAPGMPWFGAGSAVSRVVTVGLDHATCYFRLTARMTNPPAIPEGMVTIPAGSFVMGATTNVYHESYAEETPQHTVSISAFYMATTEVTKAEWDVVAEWAWTNGFYINEAQASGVAADHPAYSITWEEAVMWCNARSLMEGRAPCYTNQNGTVYTNGTFAGGCDWAADGYRLPTEAEWEYAARGGADDHRFSWTDADTIQHARANYYSSSSFFYDTSPTRNYHPDTGGSPMTLPAASLSTNAFGLRGMAGNVIEWCNDYYAADYYAGSSGTDPRGPDSGDTRVMRGGGWNSYARECRVARRAERDPTTGNHDLGFRPVRKGP